ncbi:hypothetical protein ABL78_5657 [Leptomonas seymouri]|uniref:Cilia- and flagella-associated protein 206 n=1 Tax=Leptomonas seymouri TaxID=5684 RepID=A0A0N1HWJ8_LEPSE|nr:hypothetical protein ABL78_5657 [Leptomonas seymouri]|eukprot:KPI85290.1 hypothetical protein ABL78_5657 [Leptomonas seymouri]
MDVVPIVAQETASRYHQKTGERAMNSAVTADLTALLTRLWLLNNKEGLDEVGDVASTVPAIEQQVEDMVDYLLHRCHPPSLSTLALQVRCDNLRTSRVEQARQAAVRKEAIAVQLEEALLSMEAGLVTVEQVWAALTVSLIHHYGSVSSLLHSSNVSAATAHAGVQASSTNDPAYGESISAVSAALPRAQVAAFLRQDRVERAGQLRQLRRIAWGLRLYQKETGRSAGTDMVPLAATVDPPLASLEKKCGDALTDLMSRIRLTRALLTSPTCALTKEAVSILREEYHHLLLTLHVLKCVQCGLQQLRSCVSGRVLETYQTTLSELRELLAPNGRSSAAATATRGSSTAGGAPGATGSAGGAAPSEAASKKVIFPKFMELADAYELGMKCAEEYNHYVSLLHTVSESLEGYTSTLPTHAAEDAFAREKANEEAAAAAAAAHPPTTTPAALAAEVNAILDSATTRQRLPADVHVRYCAEPPLHTSDAAVAQLYPQSLCAMRGYCPVQYLEGRPASGLLLPGQVAQHPPAEPSSASAAVGDVLLGCIEVSGGSGKTALRRPLHFLFADAAAMRAFASDPWRYVHGCLRVFHPEEPSVSLVMGLSEELPRELYLEGARTIEKLSSAESKTQASLGKADCGTQTGQRDPYINHHYFWNEWDLRRHALKLANLMQMRTHSSQTAASHARRDATTQVNPLTDSETQTLQDAATQPARVVQYLKGLRGTETSAVEQVQHVVEY